MTKKKLATIWLGGCSGCHMSLLDIDERILDVVKLADIVKSPVVDGNHENVGASPSEAHSFVALQRVHRCLQDNICQCKYLFLGHKTAENILVIYHLLPWLGFSTFLKELK